jgi:choline monooxygenase
MFLNDTHRPQCLSAAQYHEADCFELERRLILEPAWHCVGVTTDIPGEGDFITISLLDRPLIIRRSGGVIRAHLNVCAHRFCTLSDARRGKVEKLKCPYHGWEYDDDGQTRRIPDSASFRPLKKGQLGLKSFPIEVRGSLIFVSLRDTPASIEQQLDGHHERIGAWFSDAWQPMMRYDDELDCNWKTYLENGLESYHIEEVHARTLVRIPDETACHHEFGKRSTHFCATEEAASPVARWLDHRFHRLLGLPRQPYQHIHVYPTLTFIRLAMFSYLESLLPISATKTQVVTRGFVYRDQDRPLSHPLSKLAGCFGNRLLKKIQDEDFEILRLNQAGIAAPRRPRGGLISAREERIFHFQNYINQQCESSSPDSQPSLPPDSPAS